MNSLPSIPWLRLWGQTDAKLLWRAPRSLILRANFGGPLVFARWLLVKNEHNVESHALLWNEHFLIAVDNEVAALIVATFTRIFHDLFLVQRAQMTKFRSNHYWDFADLHLILIKGGLFWKDGRYTCHGILLSILDLLYLNMAIYFGLVGEASNSGYMRQNGLVWTVTFLLTRILVYGGRSKDHLVSRLLVIRAKIAARLRDRLNSELFNNLLNLVLQEAFKWEDLLCNQSVLFKVRVNYFPAIVLVD